MQVVINGLGVTDAKPHLPKIQGLVVLFLQYLGIDGDFVLTLAREAHGMEADGVKFRKYNDRSVELLVQPSGADTCRNAYLNPGKGSPSAAKIGSLALKLPRRMFNPRELKLATPSKPQKLEATPVPVPSTPLPAPAPSETPQPKTRKGSFRFTNDRTNVWLAVLAAIEMVQGAPNRSVRVIGFGTALAKLLDLKAKQMPMIVKYLESSGYLERTINADAKRHVDKEWFTVTDKGYAFVGQKRESAAPAVVPVHAEPVAPTETVGTETTKSVASTEQIIGVGVPDEDPIRGLKELIAKSDEYTLHANVLRENEGKIDILKAERDQVASRLAELDAEIATLDGNLRLARTKVQDPKLIEARENANKIRALLDTRK